VRDAHFEGVVLEQVSDTGLRLVAGPSFYDDGDCRGRLAVVDGSDADATRISHGRKTAAGDGPGHSSACARQHYFRFFYFDARKSRAKQSWPLSYHTGGPLSSARDLRRFFVVFWGDGMKGSQQTGLKFHE
jgi:hypothetical protein